MTERAESVVLACVCVCSVCAMCGIITSILNVNDVVVVANVIVNVAILGSY